MLRSFLDRLKSQTESNKFFKTEHIKSDIKGRAVRGFAVTIIAQTAKHVLAIGSSIIVARLLTPKDFGLVAMVTAVTGLLAIFKDLGLSYATVQKDEINHHEVSTLFWINTGLGLIFCLLTAGLAPVISWFYSEPRLVWITVSLSSGFIFGGLTVQHQALLKRQLRFKSLAIIEIVALLVSIATGISLAIIGIGFWAIVLQQIVNALAIAVGTWILSGWIPGRPSHLREVRSFLVFGTNVAGFGLLNYFARNLDNVLIGRFCGAEPLGLYAKAYSLLLLPLRQMNGPIGNVAVPALSRLVDSPERYRQAYLRILEKLTILTMPAVALMLSTSDWLVLITLGPQWSETSRIFSLLGIVGLVQPVANTTGWLFITQDRTKEQLQWGVIGGGLAVISFIVGIPWGPTGVAASYALSGIFIRKPLLFWFAGRRGPVRTADFYTASMPAITATVCVLAALSVLRHYGTELSPILGLCSALGIALAVTVLVLGVMPRGRLALRDLASVSTFLHYPPTRM